jgi:hypothetical protein
VLIESSSGNLGVASHDRGQPRATGFLCVTDSRCNLSTRRLMEALGSQVHTVTEPDPVGGLLGAGRTTCRAMCASDSRYVWLNQYRQPDNWGAHYRRTAPAIARSFPELDVLFLGAGTTGTLMGCARFFREWHRPVRVVAVDAVGSVTFGGPPARRMIPGLGSGVRPELLDESYIDEVVLVEEGDTLRACHRLGPPRVPFRWLHRHGGQRSHELAGPQRRPWHHRRGHRPRPGRALPRHRLPDQLARGPLRQGRAGPGPGGPPVPREPAAAGGATVAPLPRSGS